MDTVVALMLLGGKLKTNFETLGAVASKTWTVPANKRWIVLGGSAERDQSATFRASLTDASDKQLFSTGAETAGTANVSWGAISALINAAAAKEYLKLNFPVPLDAGMKAVYTWGAAQTTPEVTLVVLEYDF